MAIRKSITSVRFVFSVPTNILLQNTMKQLVPLLMTPHYFLLRTLLGSETINRYSLWRSKSLQAMIINCKGLHSHWRGVVNDEASEVNHLFYMLLESQTVKSSTESLQRLCINYILLSFFLGGGRGVGAIVNIIIKKHKMISGYLGVCLSVCTISIYSGLDNLHNQFCLMWYSREKIVACSVIITRGLWWLRVNLNWTRVKWKLREAQLSE